MPSGSLDELTASVKRFSVNEEDLVVDFLPSLDACQSVPSTHILYASEYNSDNIDKGENSR